MMFPLCLMLCVTLVLGNKEVRPLTKCEKAASVSVGIGAYVPQCDSRGQFLPAQCWGSTGQCWCVNAGGEGIPGSQTAPGQPKPNCEVRLLTKCEKAASVFVASGVYVPQCDPQGQYLPTQCEGGFTAPCWCVNSDGMEIPGTRTFLGQPRQNCAVRPQTKCEKEREAKAPHRDGGVYVPQCDPQGQFLPSQCEGEFVVVCWCVNSEGKEKPGTRNSAGQPKHNCADNPQKLCKMWRASVQIVQGVYYPQCDPQGNFLSTQCSVSTGYCWCVTPAGVSVTGTMSAPGQPKPDCSVRRQTYCEHWRASVGSHPGAYVPQCDSQGQFLPAQCWGSTGQCWCVNTAGEGLPGSQTAPGQPKPNCEVVPLTFCQLWRNSVTHLPGALLPECDILGQFKPLQCWASTGVCWCFTPAGEGIPGTLTPPGQPKPICE